MTELSPTMARLDVPVYGVGAEPSPFNGVEVWSEQSLIRWNWPQASPPRRRPLPLLASENTMHTHTMHMHAHSGAVSGCSRALLLASQNTTVHSFLPLKTLHYTARVVCECSRSRSTCACTLSTRHRRSTWTAATPRRPRRAKSGTLQRSRPRRFGREGKLDSLPLVA